jgi:Predicted membrane protein (DUF2207) C-terminal domain
MFIMTAHDRLAFTAVLAVCAYYLFAWMLFGKDRTAGVVVPLYSPPRNLSPAMLRYVWKEEFDDRTFWAGILSLVAKGLASLHCEGGLAQLRATPTANSRTVLPEEEEILLKELVRGHTRKGYSVSMLDPKTILAVSRMADSLRRVAVGHWFRENRAFVVAGVLLSAGSLCVVASPHFIDQWGVLILSLAMMAPAAFYLFFLLFRLWDLLRTTYEKLDDAVLRRLALVLIMILPCIAAIILGAIILGTTFGTPFLFVALFLILLNVLLLQWMKAPTPEGGQLLTEIEGFRLFLKSVERLPMQRSEPPTKNAGLYEKYLPYAVALELEQAWGDQFVALASTHHEGAGVPGAEALYLGMWDGKPLEIIYKADPPRGRAF